MRLFDLRHGNVHLAGARREGCGRYCSVPCRAEGLKSNKIVACIVNGCDTVGSPGRKTAQDMGVVELVRGMCPMHYSRWTAHGDPTVVLPLGGHGNHARGPAHHLWKDDEDITYSVAHDRVAGLWGPASRYDCIECGKGATQWAYDGTDRTQRYGQTNSAIWCFYSIHPEFYMPMCAKCHRRRDGALMSQQLFNIRTIMHETGLTMDEIKEKLTA